MSNKTDAPLSEHTIHVPARQTCHVRAQHPVPGVSVVLTDVSWDATPKNLAAEMRPQSALHLASSPEHKLEDGATSFEVAKSETIYVEVGNYSDTPLQVTFEIWGKS